MNKLSDAQVRAVERIRKRGGTITYDEGGYVDAAGRGVHPGTVRALERKGFLASNRDAMFDTKPQSYSLCQQHG